MLGDGAILLCELRDIPLPPSENHLFVNRPGAGRVKNGNYRAYEAEVDAWAWTHLKTLAAARAALKEQYFITLAIDFRFMRGKVFTKLGRPQRMDVQNRLKASIDCVCSILHIDDSRLFAVYCQKTPSDRPGCTFRFFQHFPIPF